MLPPWLEPHRHEPLAALVDHTLLRPEATEADILRLADAARRHRFGAVCVNGQWVAAVARRLGGASPRVVAVVGFPLGASGLMPKAAETRLAIADGAQEIDMVMSLGHARGGQWEELRDEVLAVVDAAGGRLVKVIVESAALSARELELGCRAAIEAGAHFVKTSTGFHPAGGATVQAVEQMRRVAGKRAGVKASGGIRTIEEALTMLRAGANRLGTSSGAGWGAAVAAGAPSLQELLVGRGA